MKHLRLFETFRDDIIEFDGDYASILGGDGSSSIDIFEYIQENWRDFTDRQIDQIKNIAKVGKNFIKMETPYNNSKEINRKFIETNKVSFITKENKFNWSFLGSKVCDIPKGMLYIETSIISEDGSSSINAHNYEINAVRSFVSTTILKTKDEWYYIAAGCEDNPMSPEIVYKCDQWDSLLKCLREIFEWTKYDEYK